MKHTLSLTLLFAACLAAPARAFYEKPPCGKGEKEVFIAVGGLPFVVCAPPCKTDADCPAAPDGATAQPQCAFQPDKSRNETTAHCGLFCLPELGKSCDESAGQGCVASVPGPVGELPSSALPVREPSVSPQRCLCPRGML